MRFQVAGLGFRVLEFGAWGSGFGFRVWGFRVPLAAARRGVLPRAPAIKRGASVHACSGHYRGTLPIRNSAPLEPYSRNIPRALWKSWEGGGFS